MPNAFEILRYKELRSYIIIRFFFILVMNMQATLISWKVYEITKDPFDIGLIGLIEFIPAFITAFYAGHKIDKSDKKTILSYCLFGNIILSLVLLYTTMNSTVKNLDQQFLLSTIFFIIFCTGFLRAFSGPTFFALVSQLVKKEEIPQAATWHSGSWQIASVSGPALAGLLYAKIGITYTFYIIVILMCVAFLTIQTIKKKPPLIIKNDEPFLKSVKEGFHFVWNTKDILGSMSLDLFAVFFGGAVALLPYFSAEILNSGPEGLGLLRSAPALGSLVLMLYVAFRPLKKQQGKMMLYCVGIFGISIIIFGLSKIFWISLAALFLSGIVDGISMLVRGTILQLKTPDHMRGRVASLNSIFIMSSNELGAFESGFASKLFGVVPSVLIGGSMTIAVTIYTWFRLPELRRLEY
ncbi:MAG: MFS transporter [Chitinophagaceae bacterium]